MVCGDAPLVTTKKLKAALDAPMSDGVSDWLTQLLCRVIGHNWREVPKSLRVSAWSDGSRLRFSCSRCGLTAGFTA